MYLQIFRAEIDGVANYVAQCPRENKWELLELTTSGEFIKTGVSLSSRPQKFLAPCSPSKIIGIGANFPCPEAEGRQFPSIFLMPPSAILHPANEIRLPRIFKSVAIEPEVAVVIKKDCLNVPREKVAEFILGYILVNDLSGRDCTLPDSPPALLKKGSNGFLPVGNSLFVGLPDKNLECKSYVNGVKTQSGKLLELRFSIEDCVAFISESIQLNQGDLICLGTPEPKPFASHGDRVKVEISGIDSIESIVLDWKP